MADLRPHYSDSVIQSIARENRPELERMRTLQRLHSERIGRPSASPSPIEAPSRNGRTPSGSPPPGVKHGGQALQAVAARSRSQSVASEEGLPGSPGASRKGKMRITGAVGNGASPQRGSGTPRRKGELRWDGAKAPMEEEAIEEGDETVLLDEALKLVNLSNGPKVPSRYTLLISHLNRSHF